VHVDQECPNRKMSIEKTFKKRKARKAVLFSESDSRAYSMIVNRIRITVHSTPKRVLVVI
jgi:hypothetical protein